MLKNILKNILCFLPYALLISIIYNMNKALNSTYKDREGRKRGLLFMNDFLMKKQAGIDLTSYLKEKGIDSIIIYGTSIPAYRLIDELIDSDIKIKYIVHQGNNYYGEIRGIEVINDNKWDIETVKKSDTVVIANIHSMEETFIKLKGALNCNIISIEEVIYQC